MSRQRRPPLHQHIIGLRDDIPEEAHWHAVLSRLPTGTCKRFVLQVLGAYADPSVTDADVLAQRAIALVQGRESVRLATAPAPAPARVVVPGKSAAAVTAPGRLPRAQLARLTPEQRKKRRAWQRKVSRAQVASRAKAAEQSRRQLHARLDRPAQKLVPIPAPRQVDMPLWCGMEDGLEMVYQVGP